MEVDTIYKDISAFLSSLIELESWQEAVLNIEIQPGVLGFNGYCLDKNGQDLSLITRPTYDMCEQIKLLHLNTATNSLSKWNRLKFSLTSDMLIRTEFIWDKDWQNEVDKLNRKAKRKNPKYLLPKWHWEI
jgi:hypothetical protein